MPGLNWIETLDAFGADWSAPILVAGLDAGTLADACARKAGFGIAAEGDDWFLLAPEAPETGAEDWTGLPDEAAGTVVVRRAWTSRPGLSEAAEAAARLVAPGGRLFLADLDVDRLMESSPVRYPYQLRFTLDPEAEAGVRRATASNADLALEVGRAGLLPVVGVVVDEERGVFGEAADYWTAVKEGAWPSLADTPPEERGVLLEDLAVELSRIAPLGGLVERRPWFAATGPRA